MEANGSLERQPMGTTEQLVEVPECALDRRRVFRALDPLELLEEVSV